MSDIALVVNKWTIYPEELKDKGLIGRTMWDIIWCDVSACRDKKAYLELVEATAKEIIERVKEGGEK